MEPVDPSGNGKNGGGAATSGSGKGRAVERGNPVWWKSGTDVFSGQSVLIRSGGAANTRNRFLYAKHSGIDNRYFDTIMILMFFVFPQLPEVRSSLNSYSYHTAAPGYYPVRYTFSLVCMPVGNWQGGYLPRISRVENG